MLLLLVFKSVKNKLCMKYLTSLVRLFTSEEDIDLMEERHLRSVPHKVDIIACLGFSGKWITSHPHLQVISRHIERLY